MTGALDCGRGVAGDLDLLAPLLDVARGVLGSRDVLLPVFVLETLAGLGITRLRDLLSHGREHLSRAQRQREANDSGEAVHEAIGLHHPMIPREHGMNRAWGRWSCDRA